MFYVWILMLLIVAAIIATGLIVRARNRRHRPAVTHAFDPGHPIDR